MTATAVHRCSGMLSTAARQAQHEFCPHACDGGSWVQRRVTIAELACCGSTTNTITMSMRRRPARKGTTCCKGVQQWSMRDVAAFCMMAAKCTQTPAHSPLASEGHHPTLHSITSAVRGHVNLGQQAALSASAVSSSTICPRAHTQTAGAGLVRADSPC